MLHFFYKSGIKCSKKGFSMKYYKKKLLVLLFLIFSSCDPGGNLFLTNGYVNTVMVYTLYEYNGENIESFDEFYPEMSFAVAARHAEYSNIIAIRIENKEGLILAYYTPEYFLKLRNAYKNKKRYEAWIFSEKGLFLKTEEIYKRFKYNNENILTYYRSDEAVHDLQAMLEKSVFMD